MLHLVIWVCAITYAKASVAVTVPAHMIGPCRHPTFGEKVRLAGP